MKLMQRYAHGGSCISRDTYGDSFIQNWSWSWCFRWEEMESFWMGHEFSACWSQNRKEGWSR